jgi:hypothetical protein
VVWRDGPRSAAVYQKVFEGLRKFMLHSFVKMGNNKKRLDTLKRVYRVTPQSAIVGVLRLGSGAKVRVYALPQTARDLFRSQEK